ncbi:hypothetical protein [Shimia aestuarii]|uniref:hypothetical protein n=1 Tax=Shimia aestuarii TaxID=254406 RepID=UPI001FB28BFE|nr:hypothetical protein [Shimia aestuarii]
MPTQKPIEPLEVVENPEEFCDRPSLLRASWAELKARRGQSVNFDTIGDPAYRIEQGPAPEPRVIPITHGDDAA